MTKQVISRKDLALRIHLDKDAKNLSSEQLENLFWIKNNYLYFCSGKIVSETAARALRLLEEWWPVQELEIDGGLEMLKGAEEVFLVDSKSLRQTDWLAVWPVVSVRQIGEIQFGNSRWYGTQLRKALLI